MERTYTDFEELSYTREYLERVPKTNAPTIGDFSKTFSELGFARAYGDSTEPETFSRSVEKTVGRMVVNGMESLKKEILSLNFRYSGETGEVDGDICSLLEVSITTGNNGQVKVFEESVYTRPEDLQTWTDIYLRMVS